MSRRGRARRGPNAKRRGQQVSASRPRKVRRNTRTARPAPSPARTQGPQARPQGPQGRPRSRPAGAQTRPRKSVRQTRAQGSASRTAVAPSVNSGVQDAIARIEREVAQLKADVSLDGVYGLIGRIQEQLLILPQSLDSLRLRGYVHGGNLDDRLMDLEEHWGQQSAEIRGRADEQRQSVQSELGRVDLAMRRLNQGRRQTDIESAEAQVDALDDRIDAAERSLTALLRPIETQLSAIRQQIRSADEMLDWLDESPDIELVPSEGPVAAAEAMWLRDGDEDGPEGILFLTDQSLLFEQRETITTRRLLGIFAAETKTHIELLHVIDEDQIEGVTADAKSKRFGFGKEEILRLVGTPSADFSRLAFKLKDTQAGDWVSLIKRVMNGDIDKDRDDEFIEDMEDAAELAASFPTACPNCLATLPLPSRGDTTIQCEYCGSNVRPVVEKPADDEDDNGDVVESETE